MIKLTFSDDFVSRDYFKCDITKKRTVEQFEFELYDADDSLSFVNNNRISHTDHTVIFAVPGDERFTIGNFSCRAIHFICDDIDICNILSSLPSSAVVKRENANKIHNIMNKLSISCGSISAYASVFALLDIAFASDAEKNNNDFYKHKYFKDIMKTRDFIDNHFGENITLDKLAGMAYLSRNFYRLKFKEIIGMTPCEYISDIRLSHAVKLIKTSGLSIAEISRRCGFGSQNYLNHIIKTKLGKTPFELRREIPR